ncbi:MAG: HAMP domain-containing histidine kinase [Cyanobacteria bacterium SZAS TMP-1]|nr:HAMP domain-containing histidine kinase [Cyanobacteria bacterium SZAS TMP-1]
MENLLFELKNFRPQILHKVLVLSLFPLLLVGLIFFQLYQLVSRAEAMAVAERRQTEIVERINSITMLFANAGGSIASYSVTGNAAYMNAGKELVDKLRSEFDALDKLVVTDKEQREVISEFRKVVESEVTQLTSIGAPEAGMTYEQAVLNMRGLRSMVKQAGIKSRIMMRVNMQQKARLAEMRTQEAVSRTRVKEVAFWGFIATIVLAIVAVWAFILNITGRLALLVENARMLPRGMPLTESVGGSDELAYLDSVLHEASDELKRAAEHREQLMEMVAHDLRSPLMSSQISLEILTSDRLPEPPPAAKKHIVGVKHNIALLVGLVNDLLTVDKLEAGKLELAPEDFNVSKVVQEASETVTGLANRKQIEVVNACSPAMAHADKARVMQVIINYLSNAIKFSPKNSRITISDQIDPESPHMLCISVQDQGPGIEESQRKRLFERFYQAKSGQESKGFGLGLAICKLIVESHGGRVGVESEVGKGSIFWFTVPAADEQDDDDY